MVKSVVLASRPTRRRLFVTVSALVFGLAVVFAARNLGATCFIRVKHQLTSASWVADSLALVQFSSTAVACLRDLLFCYVVELRLIGYLYLSRHFVLPRARRRALFLRLGFFHNFLVVLPRTMTLWWHKNYFYLAGTTYRDVRAVAHWVRFTRNLWPYKKTGVVFDLEQFALKPGKKAKSK